MPWIAGSRPDPIPKIPNAMIVFFVRVEFSCKEVSSRTCDEEEWRAG